MSTRQTYVAGQWIDPDVTGWIDVVDPFTEQVVAVVPAVTPAEVDRAVQAAADAFGPWSATPADRRTELLGRLHEELVARTDLLVDAVVSDVGTPLKIAQRIQVGLPLTVLRGYVDGVRLEDREIGNSLVVREPVGVVAAITPWNYPLHQIMCKVAPALLAGCTVVLKPSEVAPRVAWLLAEAADAAGLPAGVLNLVSGTGPDVGEALVGHPLVDMVSFTGSVAAGQRVGALATGALKRVALELGGKSASVVLDDADLARAVKSSVNNAYLNAGQTCSALTRLVVPADRQDEVVAMAKGIVESFVPGDPRDPATRLGPLVTAAQRDRVRGFIDRAIADDTHLVTGGSEAPAPSGYFVSPTLFADVDPDGELAQEEVFGPVLAIIPAADEDHALEIANNSRFGLGGAVWAGTDERAVAFARRMRTGQVDVNGGAYNPLAPFGGYKQSGIGRELGAYGLEEYTEVKAIQRP